MPLDDDSIDTEAFIDAMQDAETPDEMWAAYVNGLRPEEDRDAIFDNFIKGIYYNGMLAAIMLTMRLGVKATERLVTEAAADLYKTGPLH